MWAILGEIEFEVIGSPSGAEQRFSATFVEHERISGKPLVEAVGGELEEINWTILLHERVHDVDARLRAIRMATAKQEPLALVMGDGSYLGPWLIVEGVLTTKKTTASGRIISAELQITLREYTGEFTQPAPGLSSHPAGLADVAANASPTTPVQPGLMTRTEQTLTDAQTLASAARQAENVIRNASQTLGRAREMSPAAAIAQVPGILGSLGQAARSVSTLRELGGRVSEAASITQLGANLAFQLQTMQTRLTNPQPSTIIGQMADASQAAVGALQQFDQARGALLSLTADVAMRRR